ncbi:hypothetical protein JX266_008143 [Neoarthrinium moseri]|nr:hypothetical protein JX266_008143 [Neoarthrinium moseri]
MFQSQVLNLLPVRAVWRQGRSVSVPERCASNFTFYFVNETDEVKAFYTLQSGSTHYPFTAQNSEVEVLQPPDAPKTPIIPNLGRAQCTYPHNPTEVTLLSPNASTSTLSPYNTVPSPRDARSYAFTPHDSLVGLANSDGYASLAFPLRDAAEVRLMRYYLEKMCFWFDLCDEERHFACEVPRRAITCPTLLNAIFALSSRHLSMNEQFDQFAADRYHQECLNQLSTIYTDHQSALANDDLLAATILLRTLEEMDVPLIGADHELHLHGIQLFMNTPDPSPPIASGLRKACFWTGLRQEIVMAFVNQRPVKIKLDHAFIDRSLAPANDDAWANRIIMHCADVTRHCFGEAEHGVAEYQALKEYDAAWLRARPVSFLPLAYCEPDQDRGEVFPQILYLNSAVVIGNAHAIFARALLMCYDPTIPRIGPGQKIAQQKLDDSIRTQIRELCGTALANRATIPAMFTASMGVTMCGDRFTEDRERRALLDVLVKTETAHSWPTGGAQDHLKKAWGWAVEA